MTEAADHVVAATLQRVLLPAGLPSVADWAVATLYEPAGKAVLVGGDFYDWFTLPNGNVLFFLGDVSGKGPLAGALGMSIRKALKGITWVTHEVADALPILQHALADEFGESFTTLCLLEITPGSGNVRVLLAGHPAPWWRHHGVFAEVSAPPNALLGPRLADQWEAAELRLSPNDMLVVFSDGLTEARLDTGEQFGEGSLQRLLASLPAHLSSYDTVLQATQHLHRVAPALADDVVIAVLTYRPAPARAPQQLQAGGVQVLHLSADSASAALARQFVRSACRSLQVDAAATHDAELATSELVTNALLHARTDIEVRVAPDARGVRIDVLDEAPGGIAAMETARLSLPTVEHGRGLALVRLLSAEFGVRPTEHGKQAWIVVPAKRAASPP